MGQAQDLVGYHLAAQGSMIWEVVRKSSKTTAVQ